VQNNRTVGASGHALFKLLIWKAFTQPSVLVVKRCVVDEIGFFDETFVRVENTDFILRIATRYELGFVPENLLLYYELPGSPGNRPVYHVINA
jgi:hypothetical protein